MKSYFYKNGIIIEDSKKKKLAKANKVLKSYLSTLDNTHLNNTLYTYNRKIRYLIGLNKASKRWFVFNIVLFVLTVLTFMVPIFVGMADIKFLDNIIFRVLIYTSGVYFLITIISEAIRLKICFNHFDYLAIKRYIKNIKDERKKETLI